MEILEPRMICEPCTEGDHPNCEDHTRHAKFVRWLQETYGGPDGVVVGQEESRVIKANRPYPSCSCQHKVPI